MASKTSPEYDYDLFTIGAGSGGVRASRVAASHGARVAVAEEHRVGGTCVIRGCVPKKMLVYGAHFAEDLEDAQAFGWTIENARFDWETLRDNVLRDVDRLNGLYTETLDNHGVEVINERAELAGPHEIRLSGGRTVTARHILIATGARPHVPDCPGNELGITSNEAFHLETLPRRILIAGGGYIANEFAGIFNEFGSHVTIINRSDQLLRGYDEALRDRLLQISMMKGIDFRFHAEFRGIEKTDDGTLRVSMTNHDDLEVDCVLFATGRVPNTEGLGLDKAGVKTGDKGEIVVDRFSKTSVDHIHAVGDVTDRVQLTPVAIREGQAFADTVFGGGDPVAVDHTCIPSAVFSHPPLAGVGLTEGQARNTYGSVRVYQSDFRPMKNVLAGRNERSLYKMVCDEDSGRILGIHMIGPEAAEIMQAAAVAVKAGLTKADFDATVAIHPTMAEELVLLR
ncbi:glutathione-disulfide reductase [Pelagerythrobacter marinus]|uniref:Glutathione reductase n=1 Tax=Pelagerythrobacter marinus TaxID=538382 RepID=A0ABW9UW53_9SPHN|nr:glutathione-disulfide reductase [Pelagerythrobacter marinus]MXO68142.1 glutathione-disulfide reductase [Pelagerythrobacter marinus]USA40697.1 glutathione-disulfide reductase [Pelagerythrobacter marinus]WPZ08131.1 glutathione-disulfide reductase [Pelagerythrobacter marinus]